MNAVIYARYSSDNQREESIEGQLRDCREYAERNNMTIVGNYIDRALSARTADRPDFQRMIHDSEKRLFDVVLVWKLDRFSRDRYDSAHYKHILKKNGVRVISAKEAIADGPEGIILESMLEGMAEYYSAELAVKVRRGQRENAMKCRNNGGTLAYGYSVDKGTGALVVNPKTAPIVREIFSRYDKGELIKNIVKDLNARGLRNNFGRPFQASAMTILLKNRKYIGDYCYGDMIIPGGVPALVEKDVFERVQKRMEANKKSPGRAKAKEEYLLSGKVFCGTCGGHMVGESGKSRNGTIYYYYKCINAKHGHTCKRKAIKRDWLERAVVVETVTKVLTDEVIDRVANAIIAIQGQENPLVPTIKEQIRVCDNSLQNLLKAIEAGIFTLTTKKRMEELEQQKEDLNISLIRAQMAQPVFTKEEIVKWISRFKYGSIHDKAYQREIIDTFLNSVYVYDDRIVFTYNFRDHAETITLDEIEYVFCSDVNNSPPPNPHQFWCGFSFAFQGNGTVLRLKSCGLSSRFSFDHNFDHNFPILRTYSTSSPCALDSSDARQQIGSMGVSPLRCHPALSRSIIVPPPPSSPCRLLSGSGGQENRSHRTWSWRMTSWLRWRRMYQMNDCEIVKAHLRGAQQAPFTYCGESGVLLWWFLIFSQPFRKVPSLGRPRERQKAKGQ